LNNDEIINKANYIRLKLSGDTVDSKNVYELLEEMNIYIYFFSDYLNKGIDEYKYLIRIYGNDGAVIEQGFNTFVIVNDLTSKLKQKYYSKHRLLFTLLHELGHVVLKHLYSNKCYVTKELEADYFAVNVLLPQKKVMNFSRKYLDDDIIDSNELGCMCSYFNVSWECLINRLDYLNIQNKQLSGFLLDTYSERKELALIFDVDFSELTQNFIKRNFERSNNYGKNNRIKKWYIRN